MNDKASLDDRIKMTEWEDCKRADFLTLNLTENDNCKRYDEYDNDFWAL